VIPNTFWGYDEMNASTTRSEVLSPRWKFFTKQVLVAVAAWHAMLPVVHSAETALADVPMTASNEGCRPT
jgi:predicted Zn-dependent protease